MIPWLRTNLLPIVLGVVLVFQLLNLAQKNRASLETLRDVVQPGGGEVQSLSPGVFAASQLLARRAPGSFDLAPELRDDRYFTERIIEFNFPLKCDAGARLVLAPAEEPYLSRPTIVMRSKDFELYERTPDER